MNSFQRKGGAGKFAAVNGFEKEKAHMMGGDSTAQSDCPKIYPSSPAIFTGWPLLRLSHK